MARYLLAAMTAGLVLGAGVQAQDYPVRPVRLLVPFPAGGATDVLARAIGQKLGEAFGHQFVIDNRGGASGVIATDIVAKAAPDGYTLILGTASTQAINPAVTRVPFDPVRDFTPVAMIAAAPLGLAVHPGVAARNVRELVALAKARPAPLNMASFGTGSVSHLAGELFKSMAAVPMTHVPYKGAAPAITDLMAGQVQVMFDTFSNTLAPARAGRIRLLAVTSAQRLAAVPEIPTVAESGVSGFEVTTWFGIFGPAGMAPARVARLSERVGAILGQADVHERLAQQGSEAQGGRPEELAAALRRDYAKWAKVVKDAGIRIE
jgi:tripartite-type tricarboxylate transporter receptor subunit TctC